MLFGAKTVHSEWFDGDATRAPGSFSNTNKYDLA